MIEFEAKKPKNLNQLLEILESNQAKTELLAGGTDLLVEIHNKSDRLKDFDYLVDITSLNELKGIEAKDEYLKVGSLTTHSQVVKSDLIGQEFPILKEAAKTIGSTQIRNRGTVGGNLSNASPAADLITPLIALKGTVVLESNNNKRELRLSDFLTGPYQTDLKDNEVMTELKIPYLNGNYYFNFQKVKRRKAVAIARINLAVIAKIKNQTITDIKIAFGSATPTARRFVKMEEYLKNKGINQLDYDLIKDKTGDEMVEITGTRWSTPYKRPVVGNLLKRALQEIIKEVQ